MSKSDTTTATPTTRTTTETKTKTKTKTQTETVPAADADVVSETTSAIALTYYDDGTWAATQRGLDVIGHGASAALATADFAHRLVDHQHAGGDE